MVLDEQAGGLGALTYLRPNPTLFELRSPLLLTSALPIFLPHTAAQPAPHRADEPTLLASHTTISTHTLALAGRRCTSWEMERGALGVTGEGGGCHRQ